MFIDRQNHARAHQQVHFRRRYLPWLRRAVRVEFFYCPTVFVIHDDRRTQIVVRNFTAAEFGELIAEKLQLARVEDTADVQIKILRHIEVTDQLVGELELPHSREISNDITGTGKEHAVELIEPTGNSEFDRGTGDSADVALVVGVAVDHIQLIATTQNTNRQHAGGMNDLPRHIDRHMTDRLAAAPRRLPLLDVFEIEVVIQILTTLDNLIQSHDQGLSAE